MGLEFCMVKVLWDLVLLGKGSVGLSSVRMTFQMPVAFQTEVQSIMPRPHGCIVVLLLGCCVSLLCCIR